MSENKTHKVINVPEMSPVESDIIVASFQRGSNGREALPGEIEILLDWCAMVRAYGVILDLVMNGTLDIIAFDEENGAPVVRVRDQKIANAA